ncbi:MAG: hypothetical protein WCK02_00790 [Bacteroidota bacterium]
MEIDAKKYVIIGNTDNCIKKDFVQILAKNIETKSLLPIYILSAHPDEGRWEEDFDDLTSSYDLTIKKPKLIKSRCRLCSKCAKCCDYDAIEINRTYQSASINYQRCVGCGDCLKHCKYNGFEEVECLIGIYNEYKISGQTHLLEAIVPDDYFYPHLIIKALERITLPLSNIIYNVSLSDDQLIEDISRYALKIFIFIDVETDIELYNASLLKQDNCLLISNKELYSSIKKIYNVSEISFINLID